MPSKRWTKKDIKSLCGAIDGFYLKHRPLSSCSLLVDWEGFATKFRSFISDPEKRKQVVISGIQELVNIVEARAIDEAKTADHAEAHPEVWGGSTQEIIDRFRGLEREARKDVDRGKSLIKRIETEGLPPEVLEYDPIK